MIERSIRAELCAIPVTIAVAVAVALAGCAPTPIVVAAAGDLSLAGTWRGALPDSDAILAGDLRFANLEGPITARGLTSGLDTDGKPSGGPVRLNAEPSRAAWLAGRLDVVSLENNHALDQGAGGRAETAAHLAEEGIESAWAAHPARLHVHGEHVTLLARSYPPDAPLDDAQAREIADAVTRARRDGPVLVSLHWGHTGSLIPTPSQRRFAHRIIEAGASAILGHGPHTIQGVEIDGGAVVAYSLGNLAFGCRCTDARDAFALRFTLAPDGSVSAVTARPFVAGIQEPPSPRADEGLYDLIRNLSADLGSIALRRGEVLLLGAGLERPPDGGPPD